MNQDFYNALLKRKEANLTRLNNDLKTMYAVRGGWAYQYVAKINADIQQHNMEVKKWCPHAPELLIKIILLGSNS